MQKVDRPLTIESVNKHRREECLHYEACLEEASALLWPSFSCSGCRLFMEKRNRTIVYEQSASPLAWEI
jgi:hypothetical protein